MECLINDAIEKYTEKIFRKLNNIEMNLDSMNKKIDKNIIMVEKLERDILEINIKLDKQNNPTTYLSKMEEVD